MKLMLTSFAFSENILSDFDQSDLEEQASLLKQENLSELHLRSSSPYSYRISRVSLPEFIDFSNLPPVSMRESNGVFLPDYAALLLCENVILDANSFERIQSSSPPEYSEVSRALLTLYQEGFVELRDFSSLLEERKELLNLLLDHDLRAFSYWISPLQQSIAIWRNFIEKFFQDTTRGFFHYRKWEQARKIDYFLETDEIKSLTDMTETTAMDKVRQFQLRKLLRSYLAYANANIILSNEFGTGFHDWADFLPFYEHKFKRLNSKGIQAEEETQASRRLFEISFPEFAISDTKTLIKILRDKRIADLRTLIKESVADMVEFDEKFARSVFKEVLGIERQAARHRNLVSYLTIPLDIIPGIGTFAQKAAEELAGALLDKKLKQKYRWFYLLSDTTEKSNKTRG